MSQHTVEQLKTELSSEKLDISTQLKWIMANLTEQSRLIFQKCVTSPQPESESMLQNLKQIYFDLAQYVFEYAFGENQNLEKLPTEWIDSLFHNLQTKLGETAFQNFVDYQFSPEDTSNSPHLITESLGMLNHLDSPPTFFKKRVGQSIDTIRELSQSEGIQYYFGNVANGNFDAAFVTHACGAPISSFKLYQYSRKARTTYGRAFTLLNSETIGINKSQDKICLIDGFSGGGESSDESIEGFKKHGFTLPFFMFTSTGSRPFVTNSHVEMLYPREYVIPGTLCKTPTILKIK